MNAEKLVIKIWTPLSQELYSIGVNFVEFYNWLFQIGICITSVLQFGRFTRMYQIIYLYLLTVPKNSTYLQ